MRRFWPVALIAVGLGLAQLLKPEGSYPSSALWAVNAATVQVVILWPVVIGLAAADAVRLRRTGALDLLGADPVRARVRLLIGRTSGLAAWASLGMVTCTAFGVIVARAHGSPVPWTQQSAWATLALAVVGVITSAALGSAVGSLAVLGGTWLLPPMATAAAYGFLVVDHGLTRDLVWFAGGIPDPVTTLDLVPATVAWQIGLFGLVLAVSLVTVAVASGAGRTAAVCLVVLVVALLPVDAGRSASMDAGTFRASDVSTWPCERISARSQVCLPRDQQHTLAALARSMGPVDTRLRELAPETGTIRYGPVAVVDVVPTGWLAVRSPITSDQGGGLATDVATALAGCVVGDEEPVPSEADSAAYLRALVAVARYLDPDVDVGPLTMTWSWSGDGRPLDLRPTLAEAQAALADLRTCRGFW